ncbi:phosphotransferase [Streptomyces sp. FXY-T5]|uniref:phosphotransferase n=1 Tax=Streptomyces sp. FXY-T5 TaxID=3064901 RepID=UPI0027D2B4CE|nr:phosphotransferase [Streptomyces sp. FXY-T5]WMD08437.1 phosphotransferase [Streptomyces sp. FXY-T5]
MASLHVDTAGSAARIRAPGRCVRDRRGVGAASGPRGRGRRGGRGRRDGARARPRLSRAPGPADRFTHRSGDGAALRPDHAPGLPRGLEVAEAGSILARLLRGLHAVPALRATDPALRVQHLDLHPENMILTPGGPRVIDWSDAEEGDPGLDRAATAVVLAQLAVAGDSLSAFADTMLAALLDGPAPLTRTALTEALRRRGAHPTMSRAEVELLAAAEELILSRARSG